uniref:Uncharacterized protein n=1 Tax=Panagrolaimus davidi TaxID=227884 RepID=A0A914QMX8_9BILA
MPLRACMTRDEWEREDFFKFFTFLFQKQKILPKVKKDWDDFYNATECGTVQEAMEIAGALHGSKIYTKEFRNRFYEQMVHIRELWHSDPKPRINNKSTLKIFGGTLWRYFHDFLRRKEFYNMEFVLMASSKTGYYIYVVEVKVGKLASKRIKEYGIVDEKKNYMPFIHQQEIEDSVEKSPRRFDRKEDIRKPSRRNRTPLPSIKDSEKDPSVNEFDDNPELITENIPRRPPPQYQPRFGDFVDPYDSTTKVHPEAEEEPRVEEVKIMPPPRSIPLERKEELPPLPIHVDTLHHYQEPEKSYIPIPVPSRCPSPTFCTPCPQQQAEAIPVKAALREPKPQTLPREKPKIIPIPVHRYDPSPPEPAYPEPRESKPQVPPHTPRSTDTNRVSPTPLRHKTPSPIQSFDPDFVTIAQVDMIFLQLVDYKIVH